MDEQRDIIPMPRRAPYPHLRWALYTRGQSGPWVEADYCETAEDALAYAESAIRSGQSVMIEPCGRTC